MPVDGQGRIQPCVKRRLPAQSRSTDRSENGNSHPRQPRGTQVGRCGTGSAPTFDWSTGNTGWASLAAEMNHLDEQRGIRVHRTGLRCTSFHRFQAAAVFYPVFYPRRQCSGVEMLYLLVTAANWNSRAGCANSLPSWSCGFDSRRPLQGSGPGRWHLRVWDERTKPGSGPHTGHKGHLSRRSCRGCASWPSALAMA